MKKLMFLSLLLAATPLFAQRRIDLELDVEGVHRTGANTAYSPGLVRFEPSFRNGGGVGAGLNFFFSDRMSLEVKVGGMQGETNLRIVGQDSVQIIRLGNAQMYPISALLQWHPIDHGLIRPYIGGGVAHTILHNINRQIPTTTATAIKFRDPTGFMLDGGIELALARKWSLYADGRYVPLETKSRATFVGTTSATELSVKPLLVSFGIALHF